MPAEIPVAPIPVAQSTYYASAGPMAPASGLQGALSGPWMVESQDLEIEYARVPGGQLSGYPNFSLSSVGLTTATAYQINYTRLNTIIKATYSKRKTYDTYSNATYQQPQKFKTYALSADKYGNSYGTLNTSTLGPAGTITTSQPYLSRREWNDSLDSEVTSSIMVANFAYAARDCDKIWSYQQQDGMGSMTSFIPRDRPGTLKGAQYAENLHVAYPNYWIYGPYTPEKETLSQIIQLIDATGANLTSEGFADIPGVWGKDANNSWIIKADKGINLYSKFRHDYS